jgi:uncharacterized protein with PIN domain
MLGNLARWLRILGFDTAYDPAAADAALVAQAVAEDRLLLTRDRRLVLRRAIRDRHLLLRSQHLGEQLRQVLDELAVTPRPEELFRRCLDCNRPLLEAPREAVRDQVPASVYAAHQRFTRCPACQRIYWPGGHVERTVKRLRRMGILPPAEG